MEKYTTETRKILEQWRGNDKVKFNRRQIQENGKIRLYFQEGKKTFSIDFEDPKEADLIRHEFGGKNEETYATSPKFLELYPDIITDIYEKGHIVLQLNLIGSKKSEKDISKVDMPEDCGTKTTLKKSIKTKEFSIRKIYSHSIESETFTIQFESRNEADKFVKWLLSVEEFKGFTWYIKNMVTINSEVQKHCKWVRKKAGDGSKAMELQLHYIDGKFYQNSLVFDLTEAADEMIHKECKLIDLPKKSPTAWICADALGQGKVDTQGHKI